MRTNGTHYRAGERRSGNKRRKYSMGGMLLLLFLGSMILFMIFALFNIQKIKSDLREARSMLKKLESFVYGEQTPEAYGIGDQTGTAAENRGNSLWEDFSGFEEADYVSSIGTIRVGKPTQRTLKEAVKRLEELGKNDLAIREIYENSSLYPEELLEALANNPEMADFALGYLNPAELSSTLTEKEKQQEYPLLLQWDPRWGYESYGDNSCIGLAGCGPTCMSMVLYSLTGDESLTPDKLADYAMKNGYYVKGAGTAWMFMDDIPTLYGVSVSELGADEQALKAELDREAVIICSMGPGDFTAAGHFIVIYGYDEEGFLVNDPNCVARSRQSWEFEQIQYQIKKIWSYKKER